MSPDHLTPPALPVGPAPSYEKEYAFAVAGPTPSSILQVLPSPQGDKDPHLASDGQLSVPTFGPSGVPSAAESCVVARLGRACLAIRVGE